MEQTPNKCQHIKLTLEKKILPPLLPGFELATFWSRVRRAKQQAIPACTEQLKYFHKKKLPQLCVLSCEPDSDEWFSWWPVLCPDLGDPRNGPVSRSTTTTSDSPRETRPSRCIPVSFLFSFCLLYTTFACAVSRRMGATMFCFGWQSLAVLYWVVSRFLARLSLWKYRAYNRKAGPYHCSRLLFIQGRGRLP